MLGIDFFIQIMTFWKFTTSRKISLFRRFGEILCLHPHSDWYVNIYIVWLDLVRGRTLESSLGRRSVCSKLGVLVKQHEPNRTVYPLKFKFKTKTSWSSDSVIPSSVRVSWRHSVFKKLHFIASNTIALVGLCKFKDFSLAGCVEEVCSVGCKEWF
jgi:hypothetical protein